MQKRLYVATAGSNTRVWARFSNSRFSTKSPAIWKNSAYQFRNIRSSYIETNISLVFKEKEFPH
ncbi:hypothetical protein LEP1GSC193_3402 [Leptospira alstonii serovar Pingchang str. 80-412]|uniref:Uncharacterized protein n=2 Tax=Leptospira alstonii TaxID=28452 RepID=M6CWE7_9LEPT|nr:hypothetical protein LEP1GSC194_3926 [Leptospira alstonii serovar Sichuan str. 79601]EQA82011.1 hypothetical protein LEP1GSC193_3402 [Leptospira alstonii serovar Pingchang str. 80-412]